MDEDRGKILVVDDDEDILKLMSKQLSIIGYHIITAKDGNTALTLIKEGSFDLVIIDHLMPDMNGLELFRSIKTDLPYLPVIMMTGQRSTDLVVEFMRSGGTNFLLKPPKFEKLNADIQHALQNVKLQQEIKALKSDRTKFHGLLETIKSINNQTAQKVRNIYSIADELIYPRNAREAQFKIRTTSREVGQNAAAIVKSIEAFSVNLKNCEKER